MCTKATQTTVSASQSSSKFQAFPCSLRTVDLLLFLTIREAVSNTDPLSQFPSHVTPLICTLEAQKPMFVKKTTTDYHSGIYCKMTPQITPWRL